MGYSKCAALIIVVAISLTAHCQAASKPQPKPQPMTTQEVFLPYWTLEPGWHTDVEVRNNLAGKSLQVDLALNLADGSSVPLAPITLNPDEVKEIDLMSVSGLSPHTGLFGSVTLRFSGYSPFNIFTASEIHLDGSPINFHFDATTTAPGVEKNRQETIWWMPTPSMGGFVVLSNLSATAGAVRLDISDKDGRTFSNEVQLAPHQTWRASMQSLTTDAGVKGVYGGLRITPRANSGAVVAS